MYSIIFCWFFHIKDFQLILRVLSTKQPLGLTRKLSALAVNVCVCKHTQVRH